jgi:hypothetical protein
VEYAIEINRNIEIYGNLESDKEKVAIVRRIG